MGLLDFSPNLDDPKTQLLIQMGLGLMGGAGRQAGNKNFGADLSHAGLLGLQGYAGAKQAQMQQQTQERQNRASDLQEALGVQGALQQNELPAMIEAYNSGKPYVPSDGMQAINKRVMNLALSGNLSGMIPGNSAPVSQPAPPQPQQPSPQPQQPPQPPVPPIGQNFMGANPDYTAPQSSPQSAPQLPPQAAPHPGSIPTSIYGVPLPIYSAASKNPGVLAFLNQVAKSRETQNMRPGGTAYGYDETTGKQGPIFYAPKLDAGIQPTFGPNGQMSAGPMPGYADAAAAIKGAETSATEGAKAPFDFRPVTNASGATVPMSVAQLMGRGASAGGLPFVSQPAIPAAVQAAAAKGQPFEATQTPDGKVAVTNPTQDPFADIPKRYVPQGVGQSSFDKEMASKQAEAASATATKLGSQADAANQRIALNNQALKLVDQSDTGPKAALIGDVKNWLVSRFKIPESSFQNTPSATIALQKDLLNSATQRAKQQFGSRITQSEVMLMLTRGSPNVDMTKASIKYLIDSDNAVQGYQIKQANDFGSYLQKGGDPMRFESWYASKFPATQALGQVHLSSEMNPGQTQPQAAATQRRVVHFGDLP